MNTYFAPAGRDTDEELSRRQAVLLASRLVRALMDAIPLPVVVLNDNRQVLVANQAVVELLGKTGDELVGKRPGEIIGCIHWSEGPDGCGTALHCITCGAVHAILDGQKPHGRATRECRVTRDCPGVGQALDLRVTASALDLDGERFAVCTLEDISDRKRLAVLTRLFFHDVLNTAGCIQGYGYLLGRRAGSGNDQEELGRRLAELSGRLIDEIESQRDLMYAESGDLTVRPEPVQTGRLLEELRQLYAAHSVAQGRQLVMGEVWDGPIVTDPRLLPRVLGNMIKNALEATPCGGAVAVSCVSQGADVVFSVHNSAVMAEEVQFQVFQRSFSTKGQPGRGIGTYSMKLFGERYLGGRICFSSRIPEGTTFTLALPRVFQRGDEP